jgi:hypothetical protein
MWTVVKCEHCGDKWFYHTKFRRQYGKDTLKKQFTKNLCEDCDDFIKITSIQKIYS